MRSPRDDCVGQIGNGSFKFLVRDGVILRTQGGLAPGKRGFARRYGSLPPLHFELGNAVGVLCKGGGAKSGKHRSANDGERTRPRVPFAAPSRQSLCSMQSLGTMDPGKVRDSRNLSESPGRRGDRSPILCNGYYVLSNFHKRHLFLLSLCIRAIRGRCWAFCRGRLHIDALVLIPSTGFKENFLRFSRGPRITREAAAKHLTTD